MRAVHLGHVARRRPLRGGQRKVRPLRFLEYRVGADKPHRHERPSTEDRHHPLRGWRTSSFPRTRIWQPAYAFMLDPPASAPPDITVDRQKLRRYRYTSRTETVTPRSVSCAPLSSNEHRPRQGRGTRRIWLRSIAATCRSRLPRKAPQETCWRSNRSATDRFGLFSARTTGAPSRLKLPLIHKELRRGGGIIRPVTASYSASKRGHRMILDFF